MKKFRKNIRLKGYDYSQAGLYFVTVCTNFKEKILWQEVRDDEVILSPIGKAVEDCIKFINENYENVVIDKYCIMPNHIHLIIDLGFSESRRGSLPLRELEESESRHGSLPLRELEESESRRGSLPLRELGESESRHGSLPLRELEDQNNIELHNVVGRMKSYTTRQYKILSGKTVLWQHNFYEHVIRNDEDYAEKRQYIDENVLKWNLDFDY